MSSQRRADPIAEWFGGLSERVGGDHWQPAADVYETDDAVVVRCELSGVSAGDVHVSIDGDQLRIRGVRKPRMEAGVQRLHQMEVAFGPFERVLRVSVPIEREGVAAHLEGGFLRVTMPKRRQRTIPVEQDV